MNTRTLAATMGCALAFLNATSQLNAASATILGWNNLGMHCMDSDYSVFSILPPYNTIEAQLIVGGKLVTNGSGYTVTYQAIADPSGSINTTAIGKGNFYTYAAPIYGASLLPDNGLKGWSMPGPGNTPQLMAFEQTNLITDVGPLVNWFRAEGIPISPYDDAGVKNPYPMMRMIARDASNQPIATNDVVLPVSDEMDCRLCHASGSTPPAARPPQGWVWSDNPERDYRLNILRLHDAARFAQLGDTYAQMLATNGLNPLGLYRSVVADNKPMLCAKCHLSEALAGSGVAGIPPLTAAVHSFHAHVTDPLLGSTLDNVNNRQACYRCHPGSTTKCLRGAMGKAVATDGTMSMQCQSCHGSMSQVGAPGRIGWLQEPRCENCHSGTAAQNNGQIRYLNAYDTNGQWRVAVNQTFAVNSNAPLPGLQLYRFSQGHGGLQCEACHGSTHAEFPSSHGNDNVRNIALQGHAGVMVECTACHTSMTTSSTNYNKGPHGMHPVGDFASRHGGLLDGGGASRTGCQACHGTDYRGTVLSRAQDKRTFTTGFGTLQLWKGQQVSCYECHNGASDEDHATPYTPPQVANASGTAASGGSVSLALTVVNTTGNTPVFRIVGQPQHGTVALSNNSVAIYLADPGYVGGDSFTFAANNGFRDSNLATGTVAVVQGPFSITVVTHAVDTYPAGWPAPFGAVATPVNAAGNAQYLWDFGDGTTAVTNQDASHAYTSLGSFNWTLIASVTAGSASASVTNSGTIQIIGAESLQVNRQPNQVVISWPNYMGDVLLQWTSVLPPLGWMADTNAVAYGNSAVTVTVPETGNRFYRLKKL